MYKELKQKNSRWNEYKEILGNMRLLFLNPNVTEIMFDYESTEKIEIGRWVVVFTFIHGNELLPIQKKMQVDGEFLKTSIEYMRKKNPYILYSMQEFIKHALEEDYTPTDIFQTGIIPDEEYGMEPPMFILSNRDAVYGASAILFKDILDKVYELIGGDYYIVPSSVHEVLIIPMDNTISKEYINLMIQEVNETLPGDIRLDTEAYLYSEFVEEVKKHLE